MAKKYAITRTMETMEVTAMVVDTVDAEISNQTVTLSRPISDPAKLEKAVANIVNKGNIKFVSIVDTKISSKVLGISEQDFLAHAVELDPKTRKPYESEPATDNT